MAKEYQVINKDSPYVADAHKSVVISETVTNTVSKSLSIAQLKDRISGREYQISLLQGANDDDAALIAEIVAATGLDPEKLAEPMPVAPTDEDKV